MAGNYFIVYDLLTPGQDYKRVHDAIKSLGDYYQFQYSAFYVRTSLSTEAAYSRVRAAMDVNDRLAVIDSNSAFVDWPLEDRAAINVAWLAPPKRIAA